MEKWRMGMGDHPRQNGLPAIRMHPDGGEVLLVFPEESAQNSPSPPPELWAWSIEGIDNR
jgi:hypothetical protein